MKQVYIIQENHPKLLLFFTGWAADETPFKQYHPAGMDYMICYDYRSPEFDPSALERYESIYVVTWSMGVWVGKNVINGLSKQLRDKIVTTTAFNGTVYPISDDRGIPSSIFLGTLDGLTPASLQKFMRRMCKDAVAYKEFMAITPRRNFEEIKEELAGIKDAYAEGAEGSFRYDYCFIGTRDRIFPPCNMLLAHEDTAHCHQVDCAHYDEPMFRFLLQDQWSMSIDEHKKYVQSIDVPLECEDK
ncbi:MAG: DUF452 family protein [Bacteroides sp.]|nr:DUF452 family protein [Bacteroides sp.]